MVQTDSSFSDNTSTHLTGAPVLTERECDDVGMLTADTRRIEYGLMQHFLAAALVAQFTNVHLSKSSVTNLARSFLDYFANQTASPSDIPDEAVVTPPSITAAFIDSQITDPGNVTVEHEVTLPSPDSPPVVTVLSDVTESKETGLAGHGDTAMLTAEPAPAPVPGVAVLSGPVLPSVLVPPPDAPGSTSTWYRLYRGYSYCVPAPDSPAPFYCVTKGLRVGIFSGW